MKIVVCGSFRRDFHVLKHDFAVFESLGCEILSPKSLGFVSDFKDGWAPLPGQEGRSAHSLQREHLEAIRGADLAWFHAPGGYLGLSGAMELGFALACSIPVYSRWSLSDASRGFIYVASPTEAAAAATARRKLT